MLKVSCIFVHSLTEKSPLKKKTLNISTFFALQLWNQKRLKTWHLQGAKKELPSVFRPSTCFSRNTGSAEGTTCVFFCPQRNTVGLFCGLFFGGGHKPWKSKVEELSWFEWYELLMVQNSGKLTSWGWQLKSHCLYGFIDPFGGWPWDFRSINYVWICKGWVCSWDFKSVVSWWAEKSLLWSHGLGCFVAIWWCDAKWWAFFLETRGPPQWLEFKGRTRWWTFNMPPWRIIPARK